MDSIRERSPGKRICKRMHRPCSEAEEGLIKYAFEETDTNRLWLDVYPDNIAGINLYESLGMHKDGILRQNYKAERGYLDQIIYSILREEIKNND